MAKNGEHGGNGKKAGEITKMQDAYVEARVSGKTGTEARDMAGYSPNSRPYTIEREGGPVREKIVQALAAAGITEEFVAQQYAKGLDLSVENGAKERDLNSHAQYLKQLGFLLGYTKSTPSVAVQINNNQVSTSGIDSESASELLRLIREEIESRRSGEVHAEDPGTSDSEPHHGMDWPSHEAQAPGSGGQP